MANLSIKYMGLNLKSPLILGSCGLSTHINNLYAAEKAGFGAVVLKSVFEEQIRYEINATYNKTEETHSQAYDYISHYQEMASFEKYLFLVREARASLNIPVIASVNCFSAEGWMHYAKAIEEAGAHALEVNYFMLPVNFNKTADDYAEPYFKLVEELKKTLSIPVALKTSTYFTDFAHFIQKLSYTGLDAIVLFNRFHAPDINLDKMEFFLSNNLSHPEELLNTLRWVGILSEHLRCDISATTGCHNAEGLIKLILAGADSVQAASVFYEKGIEYAAVMLKGLSDWMDKNGYETVDDFKAKLNYTNIEDPSAYFRIQFMKHLSGIE